MSNALTVVQQGQPVMYVAPGKAKYSAAKSFLASGSGNKSQFAGTHLSWNGKHGRIVEGFGNSKGTCKLDTFVVNIANTIRVWRYWPESSKGPTFPYICLPFAAQSLPARSEVDDGSETRFDKLKKKDMSVWDEGLMLILRDPNSDKLYHMELYNNARGQAMGSLLNMLDDCEANPGLLPVVQFSSNTVKLDDGGDFEALVMTVVDWVEATDVDNPGALAEAAEEVPEDGVDTAPKEVEDGEEQEAEEQEAEEVEEAPPAPRRAAPKAAPKAAAAPVVQRVSRGTSNAPAKPTPAPAPKAVAKPATFKPASKPTPAPAPKALVGQKIGAKKRPMKVADDEASED